MKTILIAILALLSTGTFAQQSVSWNGGTPGEETSWNEARNWSTNSVPDEYSNVIIANANTGHNAQPVIDSEVTVSSITISNGTKLTIKETGKLTIDGAYNYSEGIAFYGGEIINQGAVYFYNLAIELPNQYLVAIQNSGSIFVNNKLKSNQKAATFKLVENKR